MRFLHNLYNCYVIILLSRLLIKYKIINTQKRFINHTCVARDQRKNFGSRVGVYVP